MIIKVLQIIAVIATILTGLVSLVNPRGVQGFTGLTAPGATRHHRNPLDPWRAFHRAGHRRLFARHTRDLSNAWHHVSRHRRGAARFHLFG